MQRGKALLKYLHPKDPKLLPRFQRRESFTSESFGSHNGVAEDSSRLGCEAVSLGK
jgi:hypothetical protein